MKSAQEVEVMLKGLDDTNITSLLSKYDEIKSVTKHLAELEESIRNKVKVFMKEKNWDRYVDKDNKISVAISKEKREKIDKEQLKMMITEAQYAQVINITTFEKMLILTPEARKRLRKYVKKDRI